MLAQGTEEVRQQAAAMLPLRDQNEELAAANRLLKEQLEGYHSKFEEFQGTLTKSNQVRPGCLAGAGAWRRQSQRRLGLRPGLQLEPECKQRLAGACGACRGLQAVGGCWLASSSPRLSSRGALSRGRAQDGRACAAGV
jgi:hypothetical protein